MAFKVISNRDFQNASGFTNHQFKRLDDLFCRAAAAKTLNFRAVDCDLDEGMASFTYCKAPNHPPYLQFVIRRNGPNSTMFELYKEGKGRVAKSALFDRVFDRLRAEVEVLGD
ncbi:MAG: hypothetical protein EOM26_09840 [Alphaproteobacteria bacterium]|nr:hypothetical protein [Alphaproteobacteria bacterium]